MVTRESAGGRVRRSSRRYHATLRSGLVVLLALVPAPERARAAEPEVTMDDPRNAAALRLMTEFADRTGLTGGGAEQRYLWTDAFAVCNFLGLARATGDQRQRDLALRLVDRVHHTLGHHRPDDPRRGWISGLAEPAGEEHPTQGGLRIGKPLPERGPRDPFDERLEWDRDGQYFHYLTRWMHALDAVARSTRDPRYARWARELAAAAHRGFTYTPPGGREPRMVWKMSIDLTRPLVASMGMHDPLDGLVAILEIEATTAALSSPRQPDLRPAAADFAAMIEGRDLATTDPLGLGGISMDALRVDQLLRDPDLPVDAGGGSTALAALRQRLLHAALDGLRAYAGGSELERPAEARLGFREIGLAIGLEAVERMISDATAAGAGGHRLAPAELVLAQEVRRYAPLGDRIEAFWLQPDHRAAATWREHRDINEVMLATRLAPEGCLAPESARP